MTLLPYANSNICLNFATPNTFAKQKVRRKAHTRFTFAAFRSSSASFFVQDHCPPQNWPQRSCLVDKRSMIDLLSALSIYFFCVPPCSHYKQKIFYRLDHITMQKLLSKVLFRQHTPSYSVILFLAENM